MNPKAAIETAAVAATAPVTLATAGIGKTLISMAVGLIGVWLARIVFVNRESRRMRKPMPIRETLPTTLVGCLIVGAIVWDQKLGISSSVFLGLGVGWTTVVILEMFGDRTVNAIRVLLGMQPADHHQTPPKRDGEVVAKVPDEFDELLHRADEAAPDYQPPSKR